MTCLKSLKLLSSLLEPNHVTIYTASHGTPGPRNQRHLRELVEREFEGSWRFLRPVMNAVGGRELSYDVIDMILQDAHSSRSGFHFIVLLLGDNNLRYDTAEPIDSFIGKVEYLVQNLQHVPKCQIILVSIIPCPKTQQRFLKANSCLRKISYQNSNFVSYLDLENSRFFCNGAINESLFYDDIHLKDRGSEILAKLIFRHCCSLGNRLPPILMKLSDQFPNLTNHRHCIKGQLSQF